MQPGPGSQRDPDTHAWPQRGSPGSVTTADPGPPSRSPLRLLRGGHSRWPHGVRGCERAPPGRRPGPRWRLVKTRRKSSRRFSSSRRSPEPRGRSGRRRRSRQSHRPHLCPAELACCPPTPVRAPRPSWDPGRPALRTPPAGSPAWPPRPLCGREMTMGCWGLRETDGPAPLPLRSRDGGSSRSPDRATGPSQAPRGDSHHEGLGDEDAAGHGDGQQAQPLLTPRGAEPAGRHAQAPAGPSRPVAGDCGRWGVLGAGAGTGRGAGSLPAHRDVSHPEAARWERREPADRTVGTGGDGRGRGPGCDHSAVRVCGPGGPDPRCRLHAEQRSFHPKRGAVTSAAVVGRTPWAPGARPRDLGSLRRDSAERGPGRGRRVVGQHVTCDTAQPRLLQVCAFSGAGDRQSRTRLCPHGGSAAGFPAAWGEGPVASWNTRDPVRLALRPEQQGPASLGVCGHSSPRALGPRQHEPRPSRSLEFPRNAVFPGPW